MSDEFLKAVTKTSVTFVIITVVGGVVAALLQHLGWKQRWKIEQRAKRREAAVAVFEDVSKIMDRRLFATSQLRHWSTLDDKERFEAALKRYRDVLEDWNGNINRLLAKLQIYFGQNIREQFDYRIGKEFVQAGAAVEAMVRARKAGSKVPDSSAAQVTQQLHSRVYHINLALLAVVEGLGDKDQVDAGKKDGLGLHTQ